MAEGSITIENAELLGGSFKNFSGKPTKYDPIGKRSFCIKLREEDASLLENDGWNVRYLSPRDPEEEPVPYIQVALSYNNYPPKVVIISGNNKTILEDEESVSVLDWAEIENVDVIIRPYNWEVNGKTGVKAYCKALYVTIVTDILEEKYSLYD